MGTVRRYVGCGAGTTVRGCPARQDVGRRLGRPAGPCACAWRWSHCRCGEAGSSGARRASGVHLGLAVEHVEPRARRSCRPRAHRPARSRPRPGRGGVDQHGGRLHARQLRRADQMTGRVAERDVQADDVGPLQQLVERRPRSRSARCRGGQCGGPPCRSRRRVGPPPGRCARSPPARAWRRGRPVPDASRSPSPFHRPSRRSRSASVASRVAARMRRNARSAVVSSSTPGVLQTVMPSSLAATTSMLSYPTAAFATTCSRPDSPGLAARRRRCGR